MPKRGGNNADRMWNTYRNGGQNSNNTGERPIVVQQNNRHRGRRVSFKPFVSNQNAKHGFKDRRAEMALRSRLEEDEDMSDIKFDFNNRPNASKFRRRGSPIPRDGQGPRGKKKLIAGTSGWFLVTIPHGNKYDKEYILRSLLNVVAPRVFIPHYFKTEVNAIQFYIDDLQIAEDLLNADRTIVTQDGFKMIIKVRNSIPQVQIDENLKQKMKLAMVKRYYPDAKSLDLSKFHSDVDLRDIFCALFRPTIMLAAIEVIAENIPDLVALKLDDNRIHLLDHLKCLAIKLPSLKILHLAKNRITSTNALDALKECELTDLNLDGNPLRQRYEEALYISEIRRKFPKLQKLDGQDLPPQIGFDVGDSLNIPSPVASFICDTSVANIVRQFLEQYFIIYDTDNRQPLLDAYHEQAMFSMTATFHSQPSIRLTPYLPQSRNLNRVRDLDGRCKYLKCGRLPVVSFLSELPNTHHDPLSFAVDVSLCTPQFMLVTVTGLFKEKGNDLLRSFQRVFFIVPSGGGFCIKNELMHVNNATPAQTKTAFKQPLSIPTTTPIAAATAAATTPNGPAVSGLQTHAQSSSEQIHSSTPDDATKLQMIQAMSQNSNMNLEWSKKCLEESNWNFERAGYVFTELHKQNKIPQEAFIK